MIDKDQYQRTFGVLHASGDFLKEETLMQSKKLVSPRRALCLCAVVILLVAMATVCYAADVGGIQRTVQIWVHGDQTSAVMVVQNGEYTLTYEDAEGNTHEMGGGGIAYGPFGAERPLTEEELLEHLLDNPEVEYKEDGSVWLYYRDQAMEITDRFNEDGICFVQLKTEKQILYVTVKYNDGYAISGKAFIQPEEFN